MGEKGLLPVLDEGKNSGRKIPSLRLGGVKSVIYAG